MSRPILTRENGGGNAYLWPRMTDLFEASGIHPPDAPLADRLRPRTLDEVVGQDHLLGEGGPIRRMVEAGRLGSMTRPSINC